MASSSRSEKRCLYEVLGISKESSPDEIRSSYRRLALQRHPDKLVKTAGLSEAEATAQFQELVHAYEVLSDPKERAWYDSHRSQILFADHGSSGGSKNGGMPGGSVPDLFAFFSNTVYSGYSDTGKGFYKVYSELFYSIYLNEIKFAKTLGLRIDSVREAPIMGNLESPYAQATAFYNYWLGFCTVMDFCWVDEYDVMAGPNRKSRRLMEEENKKLRKKAKREYNDTVRGLAEFVKKRDKRVLDMMVKKNAEVEKKKAEERERKKKMEQEKLERAMNYEEPDWAKAHEGEEERVDVLEEDNDDERKNEQLYCIVCSKKFKSDKQWKNHEQSKKHKEKVAELRESFSDIEEEVNNGSREQSEDVEELHEDFQDGLNINNDEEPAEKNVVEENVAEADDEYFPAEEDVKGSGESEDEDEDDGDDDDGEMSLLKKMVSGQRNKKNNVLSEEEEDEVQVENDSDTTEFSEPVNQKSTGKNRKSKKERNKGTAGKAMTEDAQIPEDNDSNTDENMKTMESTSGAIDDSQKDEADVMEYDNRKSTGRRRKCKKGKDKNKNGGLVEKSSEANDTRHGNGDMEDSQSETLEERINSIDKAQEYKKATTTRSKKSTRGMKTKGTAKKTTNECDKCGEEFESRTKLHKHLAETGHATLKSR